MCSKHWQRWRKDADPSEVRGTAKTIKEAFRRAPLKHCDNGCIEWCGTRVHDGYGTFYFQGKTRYAARVPYELANGPMPKGHETDHLCFNTACVNPEHLRAVTHKQNAENRSGAYRNSLTGVRGVRHEKRSGKYTARVKHNYREVYIGTFDTLDEAESAVIAKRLELFTHSEIDLKTA